MTDSWLNNISIENSRSRHENLTFEIVYNIISSQIQDPKQDFFKYVLIQYLCTYQQVKDLNLKFLPPLTAQEDEGIDVGQNDLF